MCIYRKHITLLSRLDIISYYSNLCSVEILYYVTARYSLNKNKNTYIRLRAVDRVEFLT
jgi:hypothetical protein